MFLKKYYPQGKFELYGAKNQFLWGSSFDLANGFFRKMDNKGEEEVENYVCFLS